MGGGEAHMITHGLKERKKKQKQRKREKKKKNPCLDSLYCRCTRDEDRPQVS